MPEHGYDGDTDEARLPNVFGEAGGEGMRAGLRFGHHHGEHCAADSDGYLPDPQGLPAVGNKQRVTDMDVRMFLRDTDPAANKLLDDFEFTPEEIRSAMSLVVDKWNETPPSVASYTVENFPFRYHLMLMTCSHLLTMAGYRYMRNNLQYNIPGGSVNDQDKAQQYFAAADRLRAMYDKWERDKALEMQMELGWQRL